MVKKTSSKPVSKPASKKEKAKAKAVTSHAKTKTSAAERKRQQRARDRQSGYVDMTVKIPVDRIQDVRAFVASLPAPKPAQDSRQTDLLDAIDAATKTA